MIVGIPIIQLTLFGYAINTDPKHMPTAVIVADHSEFTRIVRGGDEDDATTSTSSASCRTRKRPAPRWRAATCSSSSAFPADFTRKLLRGERPALLIEADASDPTATGAALAASSQLVFGGAQGPRRPAGVARRAAAAVRRAACTGSTTPNRSRSTTSCRA